LNDEERDCLARFAPIVEPRAVITTRVTYLCSFGLFVLLAIGLVATIWLDGQVGDLGVHGPVAIGMAIPFVAVFAIGALILSVLALRAHLRPLTTFIGVLPMIVVIVASFGIALVLLTH
jgi:hypothetical protein